MLKIFVVLASLAGPISCLTVTVPVQSMSTTAGRNITLVCAYTTTMPLTRLTVQWSFYSHQLKNITLPPPCHSMDGKSISHCRKTVYMTDARGQCSWRYKIYYSQDGQPYSYGAFKGRIQGVNGTGNASLRIFNVQPSDTGVYSCEVLNGPEGQSSKSIAVSVLAPPSQLQCGFSTSPEIGHHIALSCSAKVGLPAPTYAWHRITGDTVKPVTEPYNPQTGLFVIGNLTSFEEGYYRCTASNPLGNSTCQTDLTTKHSDSGIIVGALIGAILAAALICGIVWFLTSKEKKKKRKEKMAAGGIQTAAQKEPLNSEYVAVPSQEAAPVSSAPPSKESNETREYVAPEEPELAAEPENQIQILEHPPVA